MDTEVFQDRVLGTRILRKYATKNVIVEENMETNIKKISTEDETPVEIKGSKQVVDMKNDEVQAAGIGKKQKTTIKRKRKSTEMKLTAPEINGSQDSDEDTVSPNKIKKLTEPEDKELSNRNREEMEVQEEVQDQDMAAEEEDSLCHERHGRVGYAAGINQMVDMNCLPSRTTCTTENYEPEKCQRSGCTPADVKKDPPRTTTEYFSGTSLQPRRNITEELRARLSIKQYRVMPAEGLRDTVISKGLPKLNNYNRNWQCYSEASYPSRYQKNNILPTKPTVEKEKQGYLTRWVWFALVLLSLMALCLLGYWGFLHSYIPGVERVIQDKKLTERVFHEQIVDVKSSFPSQRPELWKRSKIHLERHLQTEQPTEPVSMILTSGRRAEKTLKCLASLMAAAFSSALNTSAFHIDGASKALMDSNQVKMDIDEMLDGAFKGDKKTAVIHRFEELPPGSTLIFYKYCDHENAAYKNVLLMFTILLPMDELGPELSFKVVEELVQDHIKDRFLSSAQSVGFNQMNTDKLSGLWSRISHLILPVGAEEAIEQHGCET